MKAFLLALLLAPAAFAQVRVEPRALVKQGHFFFSGGGTWLERHDDYTSPGLTLSASYYLREDDGLEARAAFFVSSLTDAAQEVAKATGLKPDSQMPEVLLLAGWRHSLTYGKVATSAAVIHFDVQSGLYAGTLVTDVKANPALAASLGLTARLGARGFAQLDLMLLISSEQRSSSVIAPGLLPVISFGWSL